MSYQAEFCYFPRLEQLLPNILSSKSQSAVNVLTHHQFRVLFSLRFLLRPARPLQITFTGICWEKCSQWKLCSAFFMALCQSLSKASFLSELVLWLLCAKWNIWEILNLMLLTGFLFGHKPLIPCLHSLFDSI